MSKLCQDKSKNGKLSGMFAIVFLKNIFVFNHNCLLNFKMISLALTPFMHFQNKFENRSKPENRSEILK